MTESINTLEQYIRSVKNAFYYSQMGAVDSYFKLTDVLLAMKIVNTNYGFSINMEIGYDRPLSTTVWVNCPIIGGLDFLSYNNFWEEHGHFLGLLEFLEANYLVKPTRPSHISFDFDAFRKALPLIKTEFDLWVGQVPEIAVNNDSYFLRRKIGGNL